MIDKKTSYRTVSYGFIAVILFFLIQYLQENWTQINSHTFSINYPVLVLSVCMWCLSYMGFAFTWKTIVTRMEGADKLSYRRALKIYMLTEFGKYIPGKVWTVVGRVYMGAQLGIGKKSLLMSSMMDNILSIIGILIVGTLSLSALISRGNLTILLSALFLIALGLAFLYPKIFYPLTNFVLLKFGKSPLSDDTWLSYWMILKLVGAYMVIDLLLGISFFVFMGSLGPLPSQSFFPAVAAFCLAGGLGVAAVFAPSGLGIREGVMVALLQFIFPIPIAITISLLARAWVTASEILLSGISVVWARE